MMNAEWIRMEGGGVMAFPTLRRPLENRFPYNGNVFCGTRKTVFHTMETCFAGVGEEVTVEG